MKYKIQFKSYIPYDTESIKKFYEEDLFIDTNPRDFFIKLKNYIESHSNICPFYYMGIFPDKNAYLIDINLPEQYQNNYKIILEYLKQFQIKTESLCEANNNPYVSLEIVFEGDDYFIEENEKMILNLFSKIPELNNIHYYTEYSASVYEHGASHGSESFILNLITDMKQYLPLLLSLFNLLQQQKFECESRPYLNIKTKNIKDIIKEVESITETGNLKLISSYFDEKRNQKIYELIADDKQLKVICNIENNIITIE